MRILHLSDTHCLHSKLVIPENIDVIIHSGDESNYRNSAYNKPEFYDFLNWYAMLEIPNKIFVAGNHSSYIEENEEFVKALFASYGIHYLNKSGIRIDGIKFWGDPTTPEFSNWCFMERRELMKFHWDMIERDVDVLITHGPPMGILDRVYHGNVGDMALLNKTKQLKKLKLHCFGHIHNNYEYINFGTVEQNGIIYSNASCVKDGDWGVLHNNGNIIEI